ncbi:hypothetical protein CLU96_1840 [Chryseobacterium sp. 52]|uniref:hypothetical protein n=1 Tax=Chryseobacterium sp. 52 TaxID=2035213 RepID=UPI000C19E0E8|nr:hypothetical protein [Chryseobacterium sp. 52]PIF44844.1 hypothetical protein CLU96_1840 [Chryseobacterium sp. 52]
MKKLFTLWCIGASLAVYSQVSIPETSSKGTITTQNGMTIEYKDLKFSKGKVTYKNVQNGAEEFLYENSVKAVQETPMSEISEAPAENTTVTVTESKKEISKLTDKYDIKNYLLKQRDSEYMKGRATNNIGTAFIAGGAACFVVGGLLNLSKANSTNVKNGNVKEGSPVPLIIGLIGMGAGVTLKLAGHSKMKDAVNNYRNAQASKFTPSYYVLNNSNGIGLMMKF